MSSKGNRWPLTPVEDNKTIFHWSKTYAPVLISGKVTSFDQLLSYLENYKPAFPIRKSDFHFKSRGFLNRPKLHKIWIFLFGIVLPMIWIIVAGRLFSLLVNNPESFRLQITLVFLFLVSISFAGISLYSLFRRYRNRIDGIQQLDILYSYLSDKKNKETALKEIIEQRNQKLYWKQYHLSWDLTSIFPTMTILDLGAIISSSFSVIYIFTWMINIAIFLVRTPLNVNSSFLILDITLIIVFTLYIILGVNYGLKKRHINWSEISDSFIQIHLALSILAIILLSIVDLINWEFSYSILIIIIFSPTPILSGFVISRFKYLWRYFMVRIALARQIELMRARIDLNSSKLYDYQQIVSAESRLESVSFLPIGRIRSYVLIITAFISILFPVITAFLSSVNRIGDIFSLFP